MGRSARLLLLGVMATSAATSMFVLAACVGDETPIAANSNTGTDATPPGVDGAGDSGSAGGDTGNGSETSLDTECTRTYPNVTFCDDFDISLTPKAGWVTVGNGGNVVGFPHRSAPNGWYATTPPADGGIIVSRMERVATAGTKEWRLEASIYVQRADPPKGSQAPIALELHVGTEPNSQLILQLNTDANQAVCAGFKQLVTKSAIAFTRENWHRVKLRIASSATAGNVVLTCDVDNSPVTLDTPVPDGGTIVGNEARFVLGTYSFPSQGALDVAYDDVVYDTK